MSLGEIILVIAAVLALFMVSWAVFAHGGSRRALRRKLRRGMRKSSMRKGIRK